MLIKYTFYQQVVVTAERFRLHSREAEHQASVFLGVMQRVSREHLQEYREVNYSACLQGPLCHSV